jgi:hypothetical protein
MWLLVLAVVVLVVALSYCCTDRAAPDEADYRVVLGLHAIRRRLEVAQVRTELRRDAAWLRRDLRDELHKLDERGRP